MVQLGLEELLALVDYNAGGSAGELGEHGERWRGRRVINCQGRSRLYRMRWCS